MPSIQKIAISIVIITYNEENNIGDCLDSIQWADDIVIVDSFSQDKTVSIAKEKGGRIFQQAFLGYGKQKQFAIDQAKYDWIFLLDADERISPPLAKSIENLLKTTKSEERCNGYIVNRCSFHLGKWIRHGGWYPDKIIRLLNRKQGNVVDLELHEYIQVRGKIGSLKGDLLHYVFCDLAHNVTQNNHYSSISSKALYHKGKKPSLFLLIIKPTSKFIECYLYKLGFLDGIAGFIIAVGAAYSMFLKQSKLWELYYIKKTSKKE